MNEFKDSSKNFDDSMEQKPILIIGNKKDMDEKMKQIPEEEVKLFSEEHRVMYSEVSAKKNSGKEVQNSINKLIDFLAELSNYHEFLTKR
jgi:GTPase involved in cell partitioning and DNA repair